MLFHIVVSYVLDVEESYFGRCKDLWHIFLHFPLIYQQSIAPIVGSMSWHLIYCCKESTLSLNIFILGNEGKWSWCSTVYFNYGQLKHGHPGSGTSLHLYLMSFVPHNPYTHFTTHIWNIRGNIVVIGSNPTQSTRSKLLLCNTPLL